MVKKSEIKNNLLKIYRNHNQDESLTMFGLISRYNQKHENKELIGGDWVRENVPELINLP